MHDSSPILTLIFSRLHSSRLSLIRGADKTVVSALLIVIDTMGMFKKKKKKTNRSDTQSILPRRAQGGPIQLKDSLEENSVSSSNAASNSIQKSNGKIIAIKNKKSNSSKLQRALSTSRLYNNHSILSSSRARFQQLSMSRSDDSSSDVKVGNYEPPHPPSQGLFSFESSSTKDFIGRGEVACTTAKNMANKDLNSRKAIKIYPAKRFQRLENLEFYEKSPVAYVPPPSNDFFDVRSSSMLSEEGGGKKIKMLSKHKGFTVLASPEYEPHDDELAHMGNGQSKDTFESTPPSSSDGLAVESNNNNDDDDDEEANKHNDHSAEEESFEFNQFVFDKDFSTIEKVVVERSDSGAGESDIFRMAAVETVKQYSINKERTPQKEKAAKASRSDLVEEFVRKSHQLGTDDRRLLHKKNNRDSFADRTTPNSKANACSGGKKDLELEQSDSFTMQDIISSNPFFANKEGASSKPAESVHSDPKPRKADIKMQDFINSNPFFAKKLVDGKNQTTVQHSESQPQTVGTKKIVVKKQTDDSHRFVDTKRHHGNTSSSIEKPVANKSKSPKQIFYSPQRVLVRKNIAFASEQSSKNNVPTTKLQQNRQSLPGSSRGTGETTNIASSRVNNVYDYSISNINSLAKTSTQRPPQTVTTATDFSTISTMSFTGATAENSLPNGNRRFGMFDEEDNDLIDPFRIGEADACNDSAWNVSHAPFQSPDDSLIMSIRKATSKERFEPRDPETNCKPDPSPRGEVIRDAGKVEHSDVLTKKRVQVGTKSKVHNEKKKVEAPSTSDHSTKPTTEKQIPPKGASSSVKSAVKPPTSVPENAILASMLFRQTQAVLGSEASHQSKQSKTPAKGAVLNEEDLKRFEVPHTVHGASVAESVVSSVTEEASAFYTKNLQAWKNQANSVLNNYHNGKFKKKHHPGSYRATPTTTTTEGSTGVASSHGRTTYMDRVEEEHMRIFNES